MQLKQILVFYNAALHWLLFFFINHVKKKIIIIITGVREITTAQLIDFIKMRSLDR